MDKFILWGGDDTSSDGDVVGLGVTFDCDVGAISGVSIPRSGSSCTHPDITATISTADNINIVLLFMIIILYFL
jgi:hypothetical protein